MSGVHSPHVTASYFPFLLLYFGRKTRAIGWIVHNLGSLYIVYAHVVLRTQAFNLSLVLALSLTAYHINSVRRARYKSFKHRRSRHESLVVVGAGGVVRLDRHRDACLQFCVQYIAFLYT